MDTYYQYRDVGIMIAHKLMNIAGWKVYGYIPDTSDLMADYYSPAYWGGVAEKNGYVFCFHKRFEGKPEEIREYRYDGYDKSIWDKIDKLKQMTVERGASEQEEQSAKTMIERLLKKAKPRETYTVTGIIPGHMANPPRMNWHIEKDGAIIAKGNGVLRYADVYNYYTYQQYEEDMKDFCTMSRSEYKRKQVEESILVYNYSEAGAELAADRHIEEMEKDKKLVDQFEKFINKIDTACGGLLGEEQYRYEKVKVTEYKKELKPVETQTGQIADGQLFILKSDFNYGRPKNLVYRIHETQYGKTPQYHAFKLSRKLTKECTGMSDRSNYWFIGTSDADSFLKWIRRGDIAWCELKEVKTPYEVEKVVKKKLNDFSKND